MNRHFWIGILAALSFAGCASHPKDPDPMAFDEPPADFAVAATVYAPPPASPAAPPPPRPMRPARYVLDADLVLHSALGPGLDETTFPPQTRRISQRDADRLWRLIRDSGLLDPGSPHRVDAAETYTPRSDRTTAVLTVSYAGVSRSSRILMDDGSSAPGRGVVEELALLAWVGR